LIEDFFTTHKISFKNVVGFASDGANVMMGCHQSVSVLLRKKVPNLFVLKCICHSLDLAASKACKKLPTYLEELMIDIFFYLKWSPKRQQAIGKLQALLNLPEHRILKLHKCRWLSLEAVVNRTLEQFDLLVHFFHTEKADVKNEKARRIYDHLKNPYTRLYLEFLSFVLKLVTKRNREFQSESPKIYRLHSQMSSFLKTIVSMYMREEYVDNTDIEFLEFQVKTNENADNWERTLNIDIGPAAKADLHSLNASLKDQEGFRNTCRSFLIELAVQTNVRFPFNSSEVKLLQKMQFLDPTSLKTIRDISIVANFFKFDVEEVHTQFRCLKRIFKNETETDVAAFWRKVENYVDGEGNSEFPLILQLVKLCLLLPHSSADCERIFSQVNISKTKVRNCLSTSLNGILHAKRLLKPNISISDVKYEDMFNLISQDMYHDE
jgi:hypothetical protein